MLSIFELADLWSNSTNELDYVILINKLFRRITKRGRGGGAHGPKLASRAEQANSPNEPRQLVKSIRPAKSSVAVCGSNAKSAGGGAKPVVLSPVASGSTSRSRIRPLKPAATWHTVSARVDTGQRVRTPPPPPPPREAKRTLKHRPLVPSAAAERETAAAVRAVGALALGRRSLMGTPLEPPPDLQPVLTIWKLPAHAGVVERMEKSVEEGLDSLASTIAARLPVGAKTADTGKDAASMAVVAKLAGKWRRSITRALPAATTETGRVGGRRGNEAGREEDGAENTRIEDFRSEARRISEAFRTINHRITAAADDDDDDDGDSDIDTNVPFRVAYLKTQSCMRRISSAPVQVAPPASQQPLLLQVPEATAAAAAAAMVSDGRASSSSAAADGADDDADADASSPMTTRNYDDATCDCLDGWAGSGCERVPSLDISLGPTPAAALLDASSCRSPRSVPRKSFETCTRRLGGETGGVPPPPKAAAAPPPPPSPRRSQQLVAAATTAAAAAQQRLSCCVDSNPTDPSSWRSLSTGRSTSGSSHAESRWLRSRCEGRPSSGEVSWAKPRCAGWGRQVLLDRAAAEARVGTMGLLPVVGHSMVRRSAARAVGRQHAQWGRTANAALPAWPAVQAAAPRLSVL